VHPDEVGQLRVAITRLARQFNLAATHEGLTPTQASILGVISARGPISLSDLVEIEGVHPTMLSRVVGHLVAAGFITREQDPADLRSVTVAATTAGRKAHARMRAERAAVIGEHVANLSPEHEAALAAALPALEALVSELRGSPG
jgi:DNA-binding MarR family transcriptional regulator